LAFWYAFITRSFVDSVALSDPVENDEPLPAPLRRPLDRVVPEEWVLPERVEDALVRRVPPEPFDPLERVDRDEERLVRGVPRDALRRGGSCPVDGLLRGWRRGVEAGDEELGDECSRSYTTCSRGLAS
jgi:hypothetical protein